MRLKVRILAGVVFAILHSPRNRYYRCYQCAQHACRRSEAILRRRGSSGDNFEHRGILGKDARRGKRLARITSVSTPTRTTVSARLRSRMFSFRRQYPNTRVLSPASMRSTQLAIGNTQSCAVPEGPLIVARHFSGGWAGRKMRVP